MTPRGLGRVVWFLTRPLVPAGAARPARLTAPERADAIVVLGAPLREDGSCGASASERIAVAAGLYQDGRAPLVVLSGGISRGARIARPEAVGMAEEARRRGIPQTALLLESSSRSTAENAAFVARLLVARGARRVLLVTHAYHLRRAARHFAAHDLEAWPVLLADSFLYQGGEGGRVGAWLLLREVAVTALDALRRG